MGTLLASGQAKSLELLCMQEHLVSACSSRKEATQCRRDGGNAKLEWESLNNSRLFLFKILCECQMIFHWENEQKCLFLVMLENANKIKNEENTSEKERREGKQNGEEQKVKKYVALIGQK